MTYIRPGDLVVATPFKYEYNPVRNEPEKIGIFLEWNKTPRGWSGSSRLAHLLTVNGYEECWSCQWSIKLKG